MHPATVEILQHFTFAHLPPHLQEVSRPFAALALQIAERGGGPECTAALRHLLEAKDAAVRAVIPGNAAEKVQALRAALTPVDEEG
jgi:hypothetical protein